MASVGRTTASTLLLVLLVAALGPATAQSDREGLEYRIKAAYLYKFGSYVEWPEPAFEGPKSPLVIGVVGADALAEDLQRVAAGRTTGGRSVKVRKLPADGPFDDLHVLFIGRAENARLEAILDRIHEQAVLTVTEVEESLAPGIINFVTADDRVRFDVRLSQPAHRHLKISARLLEVARRVSDAS